MASVTDMADAYLQVMEKGFTPDYMEVALEHVREWSKVPNCREDVLKFVEDTAHLPGEAVVALSKEKVSLLTNADGVLLAFA